MTNALAELLEWISRMGKLGEPLELLEVCPTVNTREQPIDSTCTNLFLKSCYSVYDYNSAAGLTNTSNARVGFADAK